MAGQAIVLVTVLAALSQTGNADIQAPKAQAEGGPHISRFAAGAGCVIFNDQADFEAAMGQGGWDLIGIETFNESIGLGIWAFDDPLCGGVPNLPFPDGLDVQNLCVQSNLEHHPEAPNPRGVEGLAAVSAGNVGVLSDIVLALEFVDSLDLLFTEPNPQAVGFNPISLLGGDMTEVRVYDTNNVLLTSATSAADAPGQNFWGVLCPEVIGRINIFDTGNGAEGGDNIQLWTNDEVPCGDGLCEADLGEHCLSCPPDCRACVCGNGEVDPGEDCDPPGSACPDEYHVCRDDCTCGPVNDDCEDAIPIFDGDTDFDTTGAGTDGLPHASCKWDDQTYHDIWFQYVATCAGELTVSTCDQAAYDTDLVVYDGCDKDIPCPPTDAELLACNDDGFGCAGFTSEVSVPVIEGNCYTVRVGGWNEGDEGFGTVTLTCPVEFCGDGICQPREGEALCNCPQDCPGECPCVQFDNRLEFEAFNKAQGQILKGIEDFEESILLPASVEILDDPLCGGVPNLPDGFPFPNGLEQTGLCVQSNVDGGQAPAPNPRGIDGLATSSVHAGLGPISDIVVALEFPDSLDLIFSDDYHTSVGLETLSMLGGLTVQISIFDKNDNLLLEADSPADMVGTHFWGVWCSDSIGRINIFDPDSGAEGGDNIQMWVSAVECGDCPTDVDGSGDTGAADLAVLLGSWGPCAPGHECACLDDDDDDIIGPFDLAVLLGAWGPCL